MAETIGRNMSRLTVKVKFTLEQTTKALRGICGISLYGWLSGRLAADQTTIHTE